MEMHYFRFVAAFSVFTYQIKIHAQDIRNDLRIPLRKCIMSNIHRLATAYKHDVVINSVFSNRGFFKKQILTPH